MTFEKPNKEQLDFENIPMNILIDTITKCFEENYFLTIKVNNHKVYNIINRPERVNKILREKVKIIKTK